MYGKLPVTGKIISVVGSVELLVDKRFLCFSIVGKEGLFYTMLVKRVTIYLS